MVKVLLLLFVAACGNASAFSRLQSHSTLPHQRKIKTANSIPRGGSLSLPTEANNGALRSSLISAIDSFYQTMPLTSAFVTCGLKASAADAVAQKSQASKDRASEDDIILFQKKRNFAFLMYGGLYQGIAQEIIFNELFPLLFGKGTDTITVASKVLFDSLVVTPLVCLPVAYIVKSVIFQYSLMEAFNRYTTDITKNGLLFKYWR